MAEPKTTARDRRNILLLVVAAILGMMPAFVLGHIVGHSSALNMNWAEGFAAQLASGHAVPRWLPEMTSGAGSAVFYFYGPLPFYLAAPFMLLFGNAPFAVIMAEVILLAASGVAAYALLRRFAGEKAALIAALFYIFLPYHFATDIWFRAALGEQASFVFIPLCVLCVFKLAESKWAVLGLALAFAGQIVSHLPTTLLLAPVLVVLSLAQAWHMRSAGLVLRAAIAAILGTGLAAFYLWPALNLQGMIQPAFWQKDVAADNLLFGSKALQALSLFMLPLTVELGAVMVLALLSMRRDSDRRIKAISLIAIALMVLICVVAKPLWDVAGVFNRVQFPWRALAILEVLLSILLALQVQQAARWRMVATVALVAVGLGFATAGYTQFLFVTGGARPGVMSSANDQRDFELKTDASEYLPACFEWPAANRKAVTHDLAQARASKADAAGSIFYYPFLSAMRDGKPVELICDASTGHAVAADGLGGDLQFSTRMLLAERQGLWVSWASLAALLALAAFGQRKRRRA